MSTMNIGCICQIRKKRVIMKRQKYEQNGIDEKIHLIDHNNPLT